jgi:hypothetical protein
MSASAIESLAPDLTFAVAFAVSGELLAWAEEASVSADEVVAVLLVLSVVLGSLKPLSDKLLGKPDSPRGLRGFAETCLAIANRISGSTLVQLLAASVRSASPLRSVRVVSLLSIATFFLFLGGVSGLDRRPAGRG